MVDSDDNPLSILALITDLDEGDHRITALVDATSTGFDDRSHCLGHASDLTLQAHLTVIELPVPD